MVTGTTQDEWNVERDAIVERMIAAGGKPGVAEPALLAGKTGLEILQAMLRGELPFPHIAKTLDFALIGVSRPAKAVFQGTPQLAHYNPLGACTAAGMRRCSTRRWAAQCRRAAGGPVRTRRWKSA